MQKSTASSIKIPSEAGMKTIVKKTTSRSPGKVICFQIQHFTSSGEIFAIVQIN